jgi:hypothetical protein
MTSIKRRARVAGVFYLLLMFAPFRLIYIPNTLFVRGDATATAANIAAHETLFRLGMVSELFCGVVVVFLTLALYRLFEAVNRVWAVLVVILGGLMPALINFINVVHDGAALTLVRGPEFLSVLDKPQRDALAMLFLRLHDQQVVAAEILWGLWLLPLALLVIRSGFLPHFLGVWLIVNGLAYVVMGLTGLLLPRYHGRLFNLSFPALLGELAFMLWLLIMGAKERAASAPAG